MHGPVLPGADFMSDPWTQERHRGELRYWKDRSYPHHSGPQLSGASCNNTTQYYYFTVIFSIIDFQKNTKIL